MANDCNVEALTSLLSDYIMGEGHGTDLDNIELAQWLADRGVLVPSALRTGVHTGRTDEERLAVWQQFGGELDGLIALLERIAKGKPDPWWTDTVEEAEKFLEAFRADQSRAARPPQE